MPFKVIAFSVQTVTCVYRHSMIHWKFIKKINQKQEAKNSFFIHYPTSKSYKILDNIGIITTKSNTFLSRSTNILYAVRSKSNKIAELTMYSFPKYVYSKWENLFLSRFLLCKHFARPVLQGRVEIKMEKQKQLARLNFILHQIFISFSLQGCKSQSRDISRST